MNSLHSNATNPNVIRLKSEFNGLESGKCQCSNVSMVEREH